LFRDKGRKRGREGARVERVGREGRDSIQGFLRLCFKSQSRAILKVLYIILDLFIYLTGKFNFDVLGLPGVGYGGWVGVK
jgi:hypothetical protein